MAVLKSTRSALAVWLAAWTLQSSFGSAWAAQASATAPPQIRILEPADGAVVTDGEIGLRGLVENGGRDVTVSIPLPPGFWVPAVPAPSEAGTFAARVPLTRGKNVVTVIATDVASGETTSASVIVVAIDPPARDPLTDIGTNVLRVYPDGGLAPHTVRFEASVLPPGIELSLDIEADGTVDFVGTAFAGRSFAYSRPGIYLPVLRVRTAGRPIQTYRTIVEVYDGAALEARLQAVWRGFTEALRARDPGRAVMFVHSQRRDFWLKYLSEFTPEELAAWGTETFTEVRVVRVGAGGAEYEMLREENGQVYSYPIVFIRDVDGRWRLWQF